MAQAVIRRPLTAQARFRSRVSLCGICGGQSGTGTGFCASTSVVLRPHRHATCYSTRMTDGRFLGTVQKATQFQELRNIGWKNAFTFCL